MTLPTRPDMRRLRQLARTLQRACRAQDANALTRLQAVLPGTAHAELSLTQAQHVVARELGLPSWPKLKLAVEAAAVTRQHRQAKAAAKAERAAAKAALLATEVDEVIAASATGDPIALVTRRPIGRTFALQVRDVIAQTPSLWAQLVDVLMLGLAHANPRVRYECAHMLDVYDDGRAPAALAPLIDDPVPRVRRMAIHALVCDACKTTPAPWSLDICQRIADRALRDESVQVRRHAVWTLPKCGWSLLVATYTEVLARETDAIVRKAAAQGLARFRRAAT